MPTRKIDLINIYDYVLDYILRISLETLNYCSQYINYKLTIKRN